MQLTCNVVATEATRDFGTEMTFKKYPKLELGGWKLKCSYPPVLAMGCPLGKDIILGKAGACS